MSDFTKVVKEGPVTTIIINRPKQLNSLSMGVLKELGNWLQKNKGNETVLIITGTGDKAFVAGADINQMKSFTPMEAADFSRLGQKVFSLIYQWPLPTIAAINGYALGGGCELALACDFRIMKKNAKIGQPEITLGIIPGFGGTVLLPRIIGEARAKDLIFSGRILGSEEALEIGLVHKLAEEDVLSEARVLAENISEKAHLALRSAKAVINDLEFLNRGLEKESTLFAELFSSHDQKEGMEAFLEKRKPCFKSK